MKVALEVVVSDIYNKEKDKMLFNQFTKIQGMSKLSLAEQTKRYYLYLEQISSQIAMQQMALNQAPAGGGFFIPAHLFANGEKGVWFDASDMSTMFQDVAGTIPVTAVGQSVARWVDKSGNGVVATQATSGNRPTFQIDADGRANLTFASASNQYLVTPSINFSGTSQMYVGVGLNVVSSGSAAAALELGTDVSSVNGTFLIGAPSSTTDHSLYLRGSATLRAAVNNVSDGDDLISGLLDISQATKETELIPRLNQTLLSGTQITWTGTSAGTGSFGNLPLYIGARSGPSLPFGGKIYQVVVRGALVTDHQLISIETYISDKIGN